MSDESFILLLSQTVTDELFIGAWKCKSALITRSLFRDAHPAHIQIHKCTHTETLTPSQPLWEAIKYWINMELSVLWWDEVKEFISHARTRTHTHTHTHTQTGVHTQRLRTEHSIIDFLFKTTRNNQHTIYYSANTYLHKETVDKKSFSKWDKGRKAAKQQIQTDFVSEPFCIQESQQRMYNSRF